ncbi:DUF2470 domain-containing protein [Micromonospora sp. LOL_024]|uniref:DUF2470 domain-containing protein n=1 Tax=Micromonospora sp. LOL_024 TaxID=3345412 RepID=UPI003A89001F
MAFHPAGPAELTDVSSAAANAKAGAAADEGAATGSDAVAARSALSTATSLRLQVGDTTVDLIGSHVLLPDGTVVVAVDAMCRTGGLLVAARGRPGAVRLDVTQIIPVAVRSRVRARVRVLGTAHRFDPASLASCDDTTIMSLLDLPPVALWVVEPVDVGLTRDSGETTVGISVYRAARPDPLAADEAGLLQRLAQQHGDVLDQLATLVDPAWTAGSARVVPVALDADGIALRAEAPDRHTDLRIPFAQRVTVGAGLAEQLPALLAEAARHGIHGSARPH